MKQHLALASLALALVPFAAFGQSPQGQGLVCTAGIQPDGYVDFSQLPPPPAPVSGQVQGPFTYTLPVTGVAGLTVQVTIPAGPSGQTAYRVGEGELGLAGTSATVGFVFNKTIYGVSILGFSQARGTSFSISTAPFSDPPSSAAFSNSVSVDNLGEYLYTEPLQEVNLSPGGGFTTTYVQATAGDGGGLTLGNMRVQSSLTDNTSLVPKSGLQQWLSSDTIEPPFVMTTTWPDSSGNHHDAMQVVPTNLPAAVQGDGPNCKPAYSFFGNQYFNFYLPIDGWQQMTVFLVAKPLVSPAANSYPSNAAAIFWVENAYWGNTFVSPYPNSENFRFGTEQTNNQPIYTRPTTIGQDFTISRAVHNGSTDSLYINGLLALSQSGKNPVLNGASGAGFIGMGYNNVGYNGEISEILVYNRVLTNDESAGVESYLRNKFGTR